MRLPGDYKPSLPHHFGGVSGVTYLVRKILTNNDIAKHAVFGEGDIYASAEFVKRVGVSKCVRESEGDWCGFSPA